ncbi:MAG: VOC family protein [Pseudomonadota bacterium]
MTIARLQHFALEVSDTDRAIAWYRDVLGFKLTERHQAHEVAAIPVELTFLRLGDTHHDLVLVHNPAKTYRPKPTGPQDDADGPPMFHHFALEVDDRDAWVALEARLRERGDITFIRGPVVHSWVDPRGDGSWGENEAFYILDPDGHRIEIFCNLASIDVDGTHVNGAGQRIEGTRTAEL